MKLPKAETLILLVFLTCTALWAVSKCNNRRADSERRVRQIDGADTEDRPVRRDTVVPVASQPTPTPTPTPTPINTQHPETGAGSATMPTPAPQTGAKPSRPATTPSTASTAASGSTLYVSIDGLKVRKEPGLKGETVAELKLYEPVTFLNKKTEWTQEISLGYEKVTDHWVKVRTQSGKEGWVFGAGVHYYKMKRKGVMK